MSGSKIKEILKLEGYLKINLHFVPKKKKIYIYLVQKKLENFKPKTYK
jgi:hypothetical protein